MASNTETRLTQVDVTNSVSVSDRVLVLKDPASNSANVSMVTVGNLLSNTANLTLKSANLVVTGSWTPSNSTANVLQGTVAWDSDYLYIAVANNTIKRVALQSF